MLTLLSSLLLSIVALADGVKQGDTKDVPPPAEQTELQALQGKKVASDAALKEADATAIAAKGDAEAAAAAATKAEDAEKAARQEAAQAQGGLAQARAAAEAARGVERKAHEEERKARAAAKAAGKTEAKAAEASLQAAEEAAVAADKTAVQADEALTKAEDAARAAEQRVTEATAAAGQARAHAKAMEKYRLAAVAYAKQLHAQEEESETSCLDELGAERRRCLRRIRNARIEKVIESETRSFRGAMLGARAGRCGTAVCWGPGYKWALEPLVELPVGKAFSMPGSSLARYLNSNELQVSFNAGLRVWLWWDWVSVSTFMSKVLVTGNDTIYTDTSGVPLPVSQIRRPLPGIGVGLFGDMLWLSLDYDQLRNGNVMATQSPDFRPNTIVSHAFTITIAVASIAGLRNGIGTLVEQQRRKKAEAEAKKAAVPESEATPGKLVAPVAPKGPANLTTPAGVKGGEGEEVIPPPTP